MKTSDRSLNDWLNQIDFFVGLTAKDEARAKLISAEMKKYITLRFERNKYIPPIITEFSTQIYRELYRLVGNNDPYRELKINSNNEAAKIIKNLHPRNFRERLLISILGNIIDYGACLKGAYDTSNLEKDLEDIKREKLTVDDSEFLEKRIQTAKNIFYLTDNSGEIVFDVFMLNYLLKYLNKDNIYIVGKESPMQNDMTAEELRELGLEKFGNIVSTGSNCFGLHEEEVSAEFKELFKKADLVIAKGQAYMEFFGEYNFSNIINVLRVKWPLKFKGFDFKPGDNIVMSSQRYNGKGKEYNWN